MSTVWEHIEEESDMWKLLVDMGFEPYHDVPFWIQELAENLIDYGWRKK